MSFISFLKQKPGLDKLYIQPVLPVVVYTPIIDSIEVLFLKGENLWE